MVEGSCDASFWQMQWSSEKTWKWLKPNEFGLCQHLGPSKNSLGWVKTVLAEWKQFGSSENDLGRVKIVDLKTSNILFWRNHSTVCLKYEGHLFTALFKYVNGTTCYFHKMQWKYETIGSKVYRRVEDRFHINLWRIG